MNPLDKKLYELFADKTRYADEDFILTMYAESGWDLQRYGDKDNPEPGAYSYGLCQMNSKWQPKKLQQYKHAKYSVTAIDLCYEWYSMWKADEVISRMLHGYNVRKIRSDEVVFL